jgi:hypothetical protein
MDKGFAYAHDSYSLSDLYHILSRMSGAVLEARGGSEKHYSIVYITAAVVLTKIKHHFSFANIATNYCMANILDTRLLIIAARPIWQIADIY